MFKIFCALALSLCAAEASEASFQTKFDKQTSPAIPDWLKIKDIEDEWEKCKKNAIDRQESIHVLGIGKQQFDIIETKKSYIYRPGYPETLCFAIGNNKSVYHIKKCTSDNGASFTSVIVSTEFAKEIEASNEKIRAQTVGKWIEKATFKVYDTDGITELNPKFSNDKNDRDTIITLKNGVTLTRDQFVQLIKAKAYEDYEDYKGQSKDMNAFRPKTVINRSGNTPKIDLVKNWSNEICFKLVA